MWISLNHWALWMQIMEETRTLANRPLAMSSKSLAVPLPGNVDFYQLWLYLRDPILLHRSFGLGLRPSHAFVD